MVYLIGLLIISIVVSVSSMLGFALAMKTFGFTPETVAKILLIVGFLSYLGWIFRLFFLL